MSGPGAPVTVTVGFEGSADNSAVEFAEVDDDGKMVN